MQPARAGIWRARLNAMQRASIGLIGTTYYRARASARPRNTNNGKGKVMEANFAYKDGCVYICSDPECNMPTFAANATSCEHCGKTEHHYAHPSGQFSKSLRAFICSHCGEEFHTHGTQTLRQMARDGQSPILDGFFDVTDH
jgi:hypothetical protein